jgi:hypothetical protein
MSISRAVRDEIRAHDSPPMRASVISGEKVAVPSAELRTARVSDSASTDLMR